MLRRITIHAFALACSIPAQEPGHDHLTVAGAAQDWIVPIHTAAADPEGGEYGTWAAGPRYKVRFGFRDVTFFPALGADAPRHLPLRWQTTAIRVGDVDVDRVGVEAEASVWHDARRYEIRYGAVTEAYDVREGGVEQTFVVHRRPAQRGDLVVEGQLSSGDLATADRAEPLHRALVFFDPEDVTRPLVEYGAATAIDAAGRAAPMATTFVGGRVELRLDRSWLQDATYPVTVDPLLTSRVITRWTTAAYDLDIGRDDTAAELMVVYTRPSTGNDHDAWAFLCNNDFTNVTGVYADVTTQWSTRGTCTALGGNRWIIAFQRDFVVANTSSIRFHLRDSADRAFGTSYHVVPKGAGRTARNPDVGGWLSGNVGRVTYTVDITPNQSDTLYTDILSNRIDLDTAAVGAGTIVGGLPAGTRFDRAHPSINPIGASVVAFTELDRGISNDDFDIVLAQSASARRQNIGSTLQHTFRPSVAGNGEYMMVAYGRAPRRGQTVPPEFADELVVRRFAWPYGISPRLLGSRVIRSGPRTWAAPRIACDTVFQQFAVVSQDSAYDIHFDRIGADAGVVESAVAHSGLTRAHAPAITNKRGAGGSFAFVYTTFAANHPVIGQRYEYPSNVQRTHYGVGCSSVLLSSGYPLAGSAEFWLQLSGLSHPETAVMMLSTGSASVPLDGLGLPGCFLLVDPGRVFASVPMAFGRGFPAWLEFALPSHSRGLTVYAQGVSACFPGSNSFCTTRGMRLAIW